MVMCITLLFAQQHDSEDNYQRPVVDLRLSGSYEAVKQSDTGRNMASI